MGQDWYSTYKSVISQSSPKQQRMKVTWSPWMHIIKYKFTRDIGSVFVQRGIGQCWHHEMHLE